MGLQLQSNNTEKIGRGGGRRGLLSENCLFLLYTDIQYSFFTFEAYLKIQETSLHLCGTEIFYIFILTYTKKEYIDSLGLSFNGNVDMF